MNSDVRKPRVDHATATAGDSPTFPSGSFTKNPASSIPAGNPLGRVGDIGTIPRWRAHEPESRASCASPRERFPNTMRTRSHPAKRGRSSVDTLTGRENSARELCGTLGWRGLARSARRQLKAEDEAEEAVIGVAPPRIRILRGLPGMMPGAVISLDNGLSSAHITIQDRGGDAPGAHDVGAKARACARKGWNGASYGSMDLKGQRSTSFRERAKRRGGQERGRRRGRKDPWNRRVQI